MARKAKTLVKKGNMSCPDLKPGKTLNQASVEKIKCFQNSDEVTHIMLGKKDYVSLKRDGTKCHVRKRLVLRSLKEAC